MVAFIFNYACYFSEIFRGGIEGVPRGQREAGQVLGMTNTQIFFRVTLMQVIKRIVPPMGNEVITLVKDTSLVRVIAVYEVMWNGQAFIKSAGIIWPLFFTGVLSRVQRHTHAAAGQTGKAAGLFQGVRGTGIWL